MGIGTSLGAFFETELDHHAGNQYIDNPNSTPDNNELSTNEVMPKPDEEPKVIPISGIKTASPLVTITDEDIDKAMGLGMSFSGGGLSTQGKVLQMRKAANDNNLIYNPREPNMIGSKELDDEMIAGWNAIVEKQQKISDLYGERAKLHDIRRERDWSDIDLARFNKIGKEINELSGDPSAAPRLETPLKQYQYAKDLNELVKQGGGLSTGKIPQMKLTKENSIGNVHEFSFPTNNGKGSIIVEKYNLEQQGDNGLYVRSIASGEGPNTLGLSKVREILKALQSEFPDATSVKGYRVSGARRIHSKAEVPLNVGD